MSGKNNKKDSFESFFRKKAEEYDIPYREEDWIKLEKKLDLREAQFSYRKKVGWIAAASILVIGMLGYFTMDNYNRINEITEQLNREILPDTEPLPPIDDYITDREDSSTPAEELDETVPDGNYTADDLYNIPHLLTDDADRRQIVAGTEDETGQEQFEETHGDFFGRSVSSNLPAHLQPLSCPSCVLSQQTDATEIQFNGQIAVLDPEAEQNSYLNEESTIGRPEYETGWRNSPRFSVGVGVSPDLSTVGSVSNFYDPGYKAGFTLEYRLNSNLSIAAGVMQSMVRYQARSGEYNPTAYWAEGIVPSEIIGECLLIDIPINLKYDFMNFNRSRFFATVGISSYIMQNEDYRFSYDSYDQDLVEGWSGETGTRHWVSNAGFSIGYELDVHPDWSLRAEPFIKVPLQEVGWGKVKLYSMGSFISINYRL